MQTVHCCLLCQVIVGVQIFKKMLSAIVSFQPDLVFEYTINQCYVTLILVTVTK